MYTHSSYILFYGIKFIYRFTDLTHLYTFIIIIIIFLILYLFRFQKGGGARAGCAPI